MDPRKDPFVDLTLAPSYGRNTCVVRWNLLAGFERGRVFVYRSDDGQTGWKLLNPDAPVVARNYYEDATFVVRDLLTTVHYRVLLELAGEAYDSPIVGIFDKLTRKEFGIVRRILELELKAMREGRQGIEVLVFSPLTQGPTCRCVDPKTRQSSQASLCPFCYGTRLEGGFHPPVTTWIRADSWNDNAKVDDPTGKHRSDQTAVRTRALAIPPLTTDDLVIHPPTDQRLVVVSTAVKSFRGTIPVVCLPTLNLLPRSDIRYQLPIP